VTTSTAPDSAPARRRRSPTTRRLGRRGESFTSGEGRSIIMSLSKPIGRAPGTGSSRYGAQCSFDWRLVARDHDCCLAAVPLARLHRCSLGRAAHDQRILPRAFHWRRKHDQGKVQGAVSVGPSPPASGAPRQPVAAVRRSHAHRISSACLMFRSSQRP
jgi:hypothetical protein